MEILSPSTEDHDRSDKFATYRLIDSFTEYLLISQDTVEMEVHRKAEDGSWSSQTFSSPDDEIQLASVPCSFRLSELYEKV